MRKALFFLCVLISAGCCIYTAAWLITGQRQRNADQTLAERFQPAEGYSAEEIDGVEGESSASFDELLAINPDVVGWIKIDGTAINHPVVQCGDNDYYLSFDLYKEPNKHGAIFLDFRCEWNGDKVIYGHYMKDGTMFHDLAKYKDEAFRLEHGKIFLYDVQGALEVYRVVDMLYWEPASSPEPYLNRTSDDPEETLLYLTTCDASNADARLIVVARRENPNQ